ncbi:MAG: hypothetical protein ACMG51_08500 [Ginsengibacter sp.]
MRRIFKWFFAFLKIVLIISFALTCLFIISSLVMNISWAGNNNLQKLSENSFALFVAFAALFFSWGRAVYDTNKELSGKLFGFGEWSFIISLLFLFAAVLNYYKVKSNEIFFSQNWLTKNLSPVLNLIVPALFFTAFLCVFILFCRLILLLNKRFVQEIF